MIRVLFIAAAVFGLSSISFAQPRPMEKTPSTAKKATAPGGEYAARYEGGMFGYSQKLEGTLRFDDANKRLVFFGKDNRELFSIPYEAILVIYPQSKSVTSTTGNVVSHIPLPGAGLAGLIKEKRRYLILQFDDPDADVKGLTNFKLESKELLDAAVRALGEKAKLERRGDAYYRPRVIKSAI
jgi:hypothetical protein